MTITLEDVTAVLGLPVDAPEVTTLCAKAGKVSVKSDFIIAKDVGLEFALAKAAGQKKKVLHTAFLSPKGDKRKHGFEGLSAPFSFTTRETLHATAGTPDHAFIIGKGKVAPTAKQVDRDTWKRGGVLISANYADDGSVKRFSLTPDPGNTPRPLASGALHFVSQPPDAPPHAGKLAGALLLAWTADRFGLPPALASHPRAKDFLAKKCSPFTFFSEACPKGLDTSHVDAKVGDFLHGYLGRLFLTVDDGARDAFDAKVTKALRLSREDERAFSDDYLGTFSQLESPYYVPDDWSAVETFGAVLDARWADFQETKFATPADLALYTKAAKLRDTVTLKEARLAVEPSTPDPTLAADLIACIDLPLTDKTVKAVLTRAKLPIGKRIDQQANPALGVAYLGSKFPIGGKQTLGVSEVGFFAKGVSRYVRGIGKEVTFAQFLGPIHEGVTIGMKQAEVQKRLGAPTTTKPDCDVWKLATRRIRITYVQGKVETFTIGQPVAY